MDGGAEPALSAARSERLTVLRVCATLLLAFPAPLAAQRLPIKTYTAVTDGLAHNNVKRIVRDSRGFLWFCTAEGLSRFDGYRFTNFGLDDGLPSAAVNDFLETKGGHYWVATDRGLARFDPTGSPLFSLGPLSPTNGAVITVLRETRDGAIWVGTKTGLYRLEQTHAGPALRYIDIQLTHDDFGGRIIADIVEDRDGSLWIASRGALHRRWPDGRAARYAGESGLSSLVFTDLLEDQQGGLWFATLNKGFFRFRADGTSPPRIDLHFEVDETGMPTQTVFQLFETADQRFWAATSKGVAELLPAEDNRGRRFRTFNDSTGSSFYDVTALSEDLDGNLWLGTNRTGVMKLVRDGFKTFGAQNGIGHMGAIFEDGKGNLCFRGWILGEKRTTASDGGSISPLEPQNIPRFGCFDGDRFKWFHLPALRAFGSVSEGVTLRTRIGEWWIGSGDGLYRFAATAGLDQLRYAHPIAIYSTVDGLGSSQVYRLFEDSRGDVWISTTGDKKRIALWERTRGRVRDMSSVPGLAWLVGGSLPRSFGEDVDGNIWIGFDEDLVARCSNGRCRLFALPGPINAIHTDQKKRLWLASGKAGLVRVDHAGATQPAFVRHGSAQGLSSNSIELIAEDRQGLLYVAGVRGLDRFDPATGHVRQFTTADGLPEGSVVAAFRDRHGLMWFGMTSGIALLAPERENASVAPTVWIDGLRVRGVSQRISALGERHVSVPELAPSQNQLDIDFVGLSFSSGEGLRYRYRLDGADTDWSPPSHQRSVTYASLSPGRYTFRVRAVNSDGVESTEAATVGFAILPPVWQRAWFLSFVAVAVGLAMYALYKFRIRRLVEIANMRMHIATDLHDDIGANLTRIALLSEVARQNAQSDAALSSIARLARESSSSMNDIVWTINPKRESLLDLIWRMRQHADEVFAQRGIHLDFNPQTGIEGVRLGMAVRRDLLLIFKEAINNAARHSGCSAVRIELSIEGSRFLLNIADNGRGFDPSSQRDGQGLASIRRRAQRLNGRIDVTSAPGSGTTVAVDVPL